MKFDLTLPGRLLDLSNDDYHNHTQSVSRSSLMDFKKSPRNYWAKHLNPDRPVKEKKEAWEFGTAFHMLILEPHLFDKTYIVKPNPVYLKDVGRKAYDAYKELLEYIDASDYKVLSAAQIDALLAMQKSLKENERAQNLIQGGEYESSFFWRDENTGLMVKARPDIIHGSMVYVDLKTTDDASPEAFQRSMVNFGNHIQAAMVKDGVKAVYGLDLQLCINICVEKTYPHSIGIYIIDDAAIERGEIDYKLLLQRMKTCIVNNEFSDYEPQTVGLPKWY